MGKLWRRDKDNEKQSEASSDELREVHARLDEVETRVSYIEKSLDVFKAKGD